MAAPSTAITRYDLSITYTEFNLRANRKKFGGLKLLPPLGVDYSAPSDFRILKLASLMQPIEDTRRAADGSYSRGNFEWEKDQYLIEEHGVEEETDDQKLEKYGDFIRAEFIKRERAIDRILRRLEYEIANTLFTSDWNHKSAVATPWSNHASATPIANINGGIASVETRIGVAPNTLAMTDLAWRDFWQCAEFEDKLDSATNDDPKKVSMGGVLALFPELEQIVILGGFNNTSENEAKAAQLERFWDPTMAMLLHVNDDGMDGDLEDPVPSVGRTLFSRDEEGGQVPGAMDGEESLIIEEYREENRRGGVIRGRGKRGIKLLHQEAGELLTGVLA